MNPSKKNVAMEWEPEAEKELERVSDHVRSMAKMCIEASAAKKERPL